MRKLLLLLIAPLVISCGNQQKKENQSPQDKIAEAHGIEDFEKLKEISFTFNVKVDDSVRSSRNWNWNLETNEIRLTDGDISQTYTKSDSIAEEDKEIDQKFINDTYWLLFPFQLQWSDAEISSPEKTTAPISKTEMQRISVSYKNDGGYTPGDTYDIFYEDDFILKEWIYKSADGNREMPTTWEDYEDFKGVKIAKSHKSPDGSFELFFSDIEVE